MLLECVQKFMFALLEALILQLSNAKRLTDLRWLLLTLLPNLLRSSFFLSVNGGGFLAFICAVRYEAKGWFIIRR